MQGGRRLKSRMPRKMSGVGERGTRTGTDTVVVTGAVSVAMVRLTQRPSPSLALPGPSRRPRWPVVRPPRCFGKDAQPDLSGHGNRPQSRLTHPALRACRSPGPINCDGRRLHRAGGLRREPGGDLDRPTALRANGPLRPGRPAWVQSLDPVVLPLCPAGGGARVGEPPTRAGRKRAPGPRPAVEAASVISPPGPTRTLDTTPRPPPSRRNRASRHPRPDEYPGSA